ncbi:hypothetical protein GCM10010274_52570 [Streptomyces lavendofoliae]|uniref:Uncharacterized protein n=1 Tax=Streptomyces lavendofoliae TaxID=67314 RepID=A0A918M6H1_9ACTN|nr:hypothetical protein GCM10010274_52570 [Streptomyces lavendofoliae]
MRARRLAGSAGVLIEVAADEANPKVTVLPSHTRPQCGQGRVRGAPAQPFRTANGPCGERIPILAGGTGKRQRAIDAAAWYGLV